MQYNTKRSRLLMPEYGRNIQQMVDYVVSIEDPEHRQKSAQAIIELMGILNPHLKNVEDFRHKLWDHLFLISDFKIEVDSPYPTPTPEKLFKKPEPLPYPKQNIPHRHLGKNICKVIDKALAEKEEEKKAGFSQAIAYCMKLAYSNWHNEPVHEDMIKEELHVISEGELSYDGMSGRVRFNRNNTNNNSNNNNSRNNNNNRNNNGNNNQHNNRKVYANNNSNNNNARNNNNNNNTNNNNRNNNNGSNNSSNAHQNGNNPNGNRNNNFKRNNNNNNNNRKFANNNTNK